MTFHAKLCLFQNHDMLDLMKWMDLLEFMIELDIQHYFLLKKLLLFTTELAILSPPPPKKIIITINNNNNK